MLKNYVRLILAVSMVFLLCGTAEAYVYTGGDWGGQKPLAADGDYPQGIFTSPVYFTNLQSVSTYNEGFDRPGFQVWSIDTRRTIVFPNWPGTTLSFFSDDYITLRQRGDNFSSQMTLALAGNIGGVAGQFNSTANVSNSTPWYSDFEPNRRIVDGSYSGNMDLSLYSDPLVLSSAVPIMPTQWLLGSGLALFALFRRRYSRSGLESAGTVS